MSIRARVEARLGRGGRPRSMAASYILTPTAAEGYSCGSSGTSSSAPMAERLPAAAIVRPGWAAVNGELATPLVEERPHHEHIGDGDLTVWVQVPARVVDRVVWGFRAEARLHQEDVGDAD